MTRLIPIAIVGTLLALPADSAPLLAQRPTTMAGRSSVYAPNSAVATSQPLASAAGLEVLRQGGNAIDAAVAAAAVLSVAEPHMTGFGGDMFAIIWRAKEQKLVALNASGRAGSLMTRQALEPPIGDGVGWRREVTRGRMAWQRDTDGNDRGHSPRRRRLLRLPHDRLRPRVNQQHAAHRHDRTDDERPRQ